QRVGDALRGPVGLAIVAVVVLLVAGLVWKRRRAAQAEEPARTAAAAAAGSASSVSALADDLSDFDLGPETPAAQEPSFDLGDPLATPAAPPTQPAASAAEASDFEDPFVDLLGEDQPAPQPPVAEQPVTLVTEL